MIAFGRSPRFETSWMTQLFDPAIRRFDEENARDPNQECGQPLELVYSRRLTDWVLRLRPDASEALLLAARCQHLCRWEIPRANYPMTRPGYLRWREDLKKFHAQRAGEILREIGYGDDVIRRVQDLNLKKNFQGDEECRVLEDALCLVFLEFQLAGFAAKTGDDKVVNALKKSWEKMTESARTQALKLKHGQRETALIQKAFA